jgi:hypothetical protein
MTSTLINEEYARLLIDVRQRIAASQYRAALSVNKELVLLYHSIGKAIMQAQAKHGWGAKVIERLSKDLAVRSRR